MISIEVILANIARLKKLIQQTKAEIREQEEYLLDLEAFLSATRSRQNAYFDNQGRRQSELNKVSPLQSRSHTADVFYDGMHAMLTGEGHAAAAGNFDSAIAKINQAIEKCRAKIAELKRKLRQYEAERAEWQAMLASLSLA